jgi:hypothetical protein
MALKFDRCFINLEQRLNWLRHSLYFGTCPGNKLARFVDTDVS